MGLQTNSRILALIKLRSSIQGKIICLVASHWTTRSWQDVHLGKAFRKLWLDDFSDLALVI